MILEKKNNSIVLKRRHQTGIFHFQKQKYRFLADELFCDNFTVFQIHKLVWGE